MLDAMLVKEVSELAVMEAYFLQALCWSLGAGLLEDGRIKFDKYVKSMAALTPQDSETVMAKPGKDLG